MPAADSFSPVAFFISLRESLEAGLIVLLGFVNQLAPGHVSGDQAESCRIDRDDIARDETSPLVPSPVRQMKLQIWAGAAAGLTAAAALGAVFLWIFFVYAKDLWQTAENLWEGVFCGIAAAMILVMGLAFLRLPHAQLKWRLKLLAAFRERRRAGASAVLFGLPFVTVLREGLEGVVFLGGIGITSSPLAIAGGAATGLAVGAVLAYSLFSTTSPMSIRQFTTVSTGLLFLIGAGLASRSAYSLERQYFISGVGTAAAESGTGPGSYRVSGNIWKLPYGDPEPGGDGGGWAQLANSIVGWNNIGTFWTVSAYIVYWAIIMVTLVRLKYIEGRTTLCGRRSARGLDLLKARRTGEEEEALLESARPSADRDQPQEGSYDPDLVSASAPL